MVKSTRNKISEEKLPGKLNLLKFPPDNNNRLSKTIRIIHPPGAQNTKGNMKCDIKILKRSIQKSGISFQNKSVGGN